MKNKYMKLENTNSKLTSVKIIENEYKQFKRKSIETGITLQELVNSCLFLYNQDNGFDKLVHKTIISGSII